MCCAPRLLHFWLPIKAQNPENNSLPRKVKKNGDLNMIDFTVFETNLKKILKRYRRITNIVMKKQQIAEIEQRLLLREILEIKKST